MDFSEIFRTILLPIIVALCTGGLVTGYWAYKSSRPKTLAEAKKTDAEVLTTFAKGWEDLYKEVDRKMLKMEERYEKRIKELEKSIEEKEKNHSLAVREKDDKIKGLENRVFTLEQDLKKYQGLEIQVEGAKETLHSAVDQELDQIKK